MMYFFLRSISWYVSWNTTDKSKSQESVEQGNQLLLPISLSPFEKYPFNITHCNFQKQCFWSENEFRLKLNFVRLPYIPNIMICLHIHSSFSAVRQRKKEIFCFVLQFSFMHTPLSSHPNPLLLQLSFNDFFHVFFLQCFYLLIFNYTLILFSPSLFSSRAAMNLSSTGSTQWKYPLQRT